MTKEKMNEINTYVNAMSDEEISCKRCIHWLNGEICSARKQFPLVIKEWNLQFPFVPMPEDPDLLAIACKEFKTLSDIHKVKREEEQPENPLSKMYKIDH